MLQTWQFIIIDACLIFLSITLGLMLRLEIIFVGYFLRAIWPFIIFATFLRPTIFYLTGVYRRFWRYADTYDFTRLGLSVLVGSLVLSLGTLSWLYPRWMTTFPRSLLAIEGLLSLFLLGGVRLAFKAYRGFPNGEKNKSDSKVFGRERALVVGAGSAGTLIVQELRDNPQLGLKPVAFLDDDLKKVDRRILGLPVFGPKECLAEVALERDVEVVVIAMPSAPGEVIREILTLCKQAEIPSKIIPGLYEIVSGRVNISRLRPVNLVDLLRREPVQVDASQVKGLIYGKRVLVTGAGGSIGAELCYQILACKPAQLVALGHGENSLFSLGRYLSDTGGDQEDMVIQVADLRDQGRLEAIFARFQPEIVFHAAAHKHVPMMETNVEDAVTNNILGTLHIARLAAEHDVYRLVLISTDKAVNPVNVMGMTKRVAEVIVQMAARETAKPFVSVRFGNVLGSRGSVVPLFQRQIAAGGPVTVTDPEMKRYFMTIPEAVQLVLQASALGENGELFVLDMGEPVRIADMARDMIELSGYQVGEDIEIVYTGLRPGERLFEDLFSDIENPIRTEHEKIFVSRNGLDIPPELFYEEVDALIDLAYAGDQDRLREKLEQVARLDI